VTTKTSIRKQIKFPNQRQTPIGTCRQLNCAIGPDCLLAPQCADRPTYVTTTLFDPFFHEFWTSTTRKGSAFHSAGYRGSPFPCTALYWCSPYCTYTYKLAERSGVESREQHEGGNGPRAMPASQPRETAHRPQQETEDCDLSRIILQYVLLAFLLPHFLRELYFLAGVGAECMEGLAHKWLTSL